MVYRIRCRVDDKYERRDQFSSNQLKKYDEAKRRRKPVEVTCLKHTTGAVLELRCDTCCQVRDINLFSKGSRKVGGRQDCRDCISWTEADQVGGNPLPMPGGKRDEREWELAQISREEKETLDKVGNMDLSEKNASENASTVKTSTDFRSEYTEEEIGKKDATTNLHANLTTKNLNKFLKAGAASTGGANTARYHPSSAPSDNLSFNVAVPANRQPAGPKKQSRVQYQAVGPDGRVQTRTQSTVNPSETASVTTMTTAETRGRGNFARPPTRKTNPDPPNYIMRETQNSYIQQGYDSDLSDDEA